MKVKRSELILIFMLTNMILVNIGLTIESYHKFYNHSYNLNENFFNRFYNTIVYCKLNKFFLEISGFETGFGFFAPNVASGFIIQYEFNQKTDGDSSNFKTTLPYVKNLESMFRIRSSHVSLVIEYIDNPDDEITMKRLDIYLKSLANLYYNSDYKPKSIKINVYLYDRSKLMEIKHGKDISKYYLIRSQKYNYL